MVLGTFPAIRSGDRCLLRDVWKLTYLRWADAHWICSWRRTTNQKWLWSFVLQFLLRSLHLLQHQDRAEKGHGSVRWLYWSFLSDSHGAHVSLSTPRECVECSVSHIEGFSGLMGGWSPAHQVPGWLLCGPLLLLRGPSTPPSPSRSAHFLSVPRCHPTVSPSTQCLKKGVGE